MGGSSSRSSSFDKPSGASTAEAIRGQDPAQEDELFLQMVQIDSSSSQVFSQSSLTELSSIVCVGFSLIKKDLQHFLAFIHVEGRM